MWWEAKDAFRALDRPVRATLRRLCGSQLVDRLDAQLFEYANSEETEQLTLLLNDSFHRMIGHNICQYYSLISEGCTSEDGEKWILVSKPTCLYLPTASLSEYLLTIQHQ